MSLSSDAATVPMDVPGQSADFSLVRGGPLYTLQRALHLTNAPDEGARRRGVLLGCIAWLPLVVLASIDGVAIGEPGPASLLTDYAAWARFVIAVPLFVSVEANADRWVAVTIRYLESSGIVGPVARPGFHAAIRAAVRRRDSWRVELLLLVLAYATVAATVTVRIAQPDPTWVRGEPLTYAGLWYAAVSLPLFHFLLLRWIWRLTVWTLLVRRTAKLDLRLVAGHPDRAGGLGVLGEIPAAFALLVVGIGTVIASGLANLTVLRGATLQLVGAVALGHLLIMMLIFVTPLAWFWPALRMARLNALVDYGILGSDLVRQFQRRWLTLASGRDEAALASPDFSALTDFNQISDVVRQLKLIPFDRGGFFRLAAAALLPFVPVAGMIVPIRDIMKAMMGLLL